MLNSLIIGICKTVDRGDEVCGRWERIKCSEQQRGRETRRKSEPASARSRSRRFQIHDQVLPPRRATGRRRTACGPRAASVGNECSRRSPGVHWPAAWDSSEVPAVPARLWSRTAWVLIQRRAYGITDREYLRILPANAIRPKRAAEIWSSALELDFVRQYCN